MFIGKNKIIIITCSIILLIAWILNYPYEESIYKQYNGIEILDNDVQKSKLAKIVVSGKIYDKTLSKNDRFKGTISINGKIYTVKGLGNLKEFMIGAIKDGERSLAIFRAANNFNSIDIVFMKDNNTTIYAPANVIEDIDKVENEINRYDEIDKNR